MVDAYTRVFITNPEHWDEWFDWNEKTRANPELACPHGLNDYGLANGPIVGGKMRCRGVKDSKKKNKTLKCFVKDVKSMKEMLFL